LVGVAAMLTFYVAHGISGQQTVKNL